MDKISKRPIEELRRVIGFDKDGEHSRKRVKLVNDDGQIRIRIPKLFVDVLEIDESKDYFEFHLVKDENNSKKFLLEGFLVKDE